MPEPIDQTSPPPRPPHPPSQDNQHQHQQQPRRKRFRFKSPSRPSSSSRPNPNPKDPHEKETRHTAHRARRAHRNRHRHRTPKTPETPDPASTPPTAQLDPDTAFRESLFDALGDDEGATYWESVYGQPIHTYAVPSMPTGPAGELEQMDEEEYAAYVRSKMWERTREGMLEEQARLRAERDRKRRREKTQRQRQAGENARTAFDEAIEASLRRGRERKRERAWKEAWEAYRGCWGRLDGAVAAAAVAGGGGGKKGSFRNLVFWPVDSGKRRDVSKENVEGFMRHSPQAANGPSELLAVLKAERVRWHPDKIQQRYGVLGIEEAVLRSVTEVFQIIDHLWNDLRTRESA
ncbi:uncharacterized protein BO66DRAFT_381169 [Aspergillus aculeatinus CBS 121060]|uniref:Uncharacterized protein n=1 Tax=Aspergillus aculeatinus CBS 121060 TaxID=1448322 RepID=A0ACD1GYS5_9EURO|nr:hypothetical protein BO66DRAFT_381169 [Aspergillus aculeatinus CBS 121060]RAH66632.1 hypothetical protein BO66DRAFT_381169 [Aspergillus aculeatinus CBS 121060]